MDRRPPPLANIITLGVQNFGAQRDFYRRLGWPQAFDSDDFAVFELRGALLALFPVDKLAADSRAQPELGRGGIRFSVIINVDKPEDVDELAARVRQAGGKLTKEPVDAEFFVGRDAYFVDPEGNFWEIAWASPDNPVVAASRRAAGMAPRPKRLKPDRKAGPKKKKAKQSAVTRWRPEGGLDEQGVRSHTLHMLGKCELLEHLRQQGWNESPIARVLGNHLTQVVR